MRIYEELEMLIEESFGDNYITEKKTKAEYRICKFKKTHDYDPKSKTVDIGDGKRSKVFFTGGSKKSNAKAVASTKMYNAVDDNKKEVKDEKRKKDGIEMNHAVFNQKHPKTHEFIFQHEVGHRKQSEALKKIQKRQIYMFDDVPYKDLPEEVKMLRKKLAIAKKNKNESEIDRIETAITQIARKYSKDTDKVMGFVDNYDKNTNFIKKNDVGKNEHANTPLEYDADNYAATKVGKKVAKQGLRDTYRYDTQDKRHEKKESGRIQSHHYTGSEEKEQIKKLNEDLDKKQESREKMDSELEQLKRMLKLLKAKYQELKSSEEDSAEIKNKMNDISRKFSKVKQMYASKTKDIGELEADMNEIRSDIDDFKSELNKIMKNKDRERELINYRHKEFKTGQRKELNARQKSLSSK